MWGCLKVIKNFENKNQQQIFFDIYGPNDDVFFTLHKIKNLINFIRKI